MLSTAAPLRVCQGIAIIGLGLGLGVGGTFPLSEAVIILLLALFGCAMGGHMILTAPELPGRTRLHRGCALIGFGLGLGMGGTFPDNADWVTWILCVFWCIVGAAILRRQL